jgi:hypothetical protein
VKTVKYYPRGHLASADGLQVHTTSLRPNKHVVYTYYTFTCTRNDDYDVTTYYDVIMNISISIFIPLTRSIYTHAHIYFINIFVWGFDSIGYNVRHPFFHNTEVNIILNTVQ